MKRTAADLVVYALEQLDVRYTFGIPGVHNTELYDALDHSDHITPVLVTHEQGASFMADGLSRASDHKTLGTLVLVPAAGLTHAASGIGEAYLAGIPMLVITGGVRQDTPYHYKLHDVDQLQVAAGFTKAAFRIQSHEEAVETIYEAATIATTGFPGPVLIEVPVNLQIFPEEVATPPTWESYISYNSKKKKAASTKHDSALLFQIERAVDQLLQAEKVVLFVGYGARNVKKELAQIADLLNAPVATTLQGLSSFPHEHPLHVGFGWSPSSVPAAQRAYQGADAMLAVGTRFSEIATGSYGMKVPEVLIHCDIDANAIGVNYPASASIVGNALDTIPRLLAALQNRNPTPVVREARDSLIKQIKDDKEAYRETWRQHDSGNRVNPIDFFDILREEMSPNAITVLDDGNHTYLTAELFPIYEEGKLLTPTDFNAMGYAIPAAIGAKLAEPSREVFAIVGDGCFTMSCMEILTARSQGLGVIFFVFNDGELSQIAQAQHTPYQRKTCTTLPGIIPRGVAQATDAAYIHLCDPRKSVIRKDIRHAKQLAFDGVPVIVDIRIDSSKKTSFTKGTSMTTFKGFELRHQIRFAKRAASRKIKKG